MVYTDDPIRDAETYYNNIEMELLKRPRCSICYERIQDEYAFKIDNEYICTSCFTDEFYVRVEDEIEYEG